MSATWDSATVDWDASSYTWDSSTPDIVGPNTSDATYENGVLAAVFIPATASLRVISV